MLAVAACSQPGDESATYDMAESETAGISPAADVEETATDEFSALNERPDIPVAAPQMAYVYDYEFRLPGAEIVGLQQRHADRCEARGPYSCQILAMTHSGREGEDVVGHLELAVVSDEARSFAGELAGTLASVGGEQFAANISGEDLSKRIIDTEARLRSRIALRDRLMEVLRTNDGDIEDLVAAERSVARINEEIDQARSWMEEMRGRVAYSRLNLDYVSATPPASNFLDPVRNALDSIGSIVGNVLAIMILLVAGLGPIGVAIFGGRKLARRMGWIAPRWEA